MKRQASVALSEVEGDGGTLVVHHRHQTTTTMTRRKTRSVALLEKQQEQVQAKKQKAHDERAERAKQSTLFETCFGILLVEGFLYRHECLFVAATSKSCNDVWEDHHKTLPEKCQVEIRLHSSSPADVTRWMTRIGLSKETLLSAQFVRHIFDYVNRIRIESKGTLSPKKRQDEESKLVKWGSPKAQVALIRFWDKNQYNNGGICISLGSKACMFQDLYFAGRTPWKCLLDNRLELWTATALGSRGWSLYNANRESLWPLNRNTDDDSSVDSEDDDYWDFLMYIQARRLGFLLNGAIRGRLHADEAIEDDDES